MSHRIGFDPSLPLIACTDIVAGATTIHAGDPVDWKALDITEQVIFDWWRSGMVAHTAPIAEAPVVPADELAAREAASTREEQTHTAGETITVPTPEQRAAQPPPAAPKQRKKG